MSKTRIILIAATATVYVVCPAYRYYALGALLLHQLFRKKNESYVVIRKKVS